MKHYIRLLRPHQWLKNCFIFAPILFAFKITEFDLILKSLYAFVGFSFVASSIYIINDWCDIEADKLHPKKKNRPLANGSVSKKGALILLLGLLFVGFGIFIFVLHNALGAKLVAFYFVLNLAYSFKLKQYSIIDIAIVGIGFVLRVFVGGAITSIYLSQWIIILTFLLALLLVSGKRKNDMLIYDETGVSMRKNINKYNAAFLDAIIIILAAITIIAYIMYTITPEVIARNGAYLYLTSLFVIIGLLRYLQMLFVEKEGDSPTDMLINDHFLHLTIACWLLSFVVIYYTK